MEYTIKNKVVIVTGGAGGIGRAVVDKLLRCGAKVSICDIMFEDCKMFAEEMKKKYQTDKVLPLELDVTQADSFQDVFDETKRFLGVVDIIINNAGIHNEQNYRKTLDINVIGVFHGTEMAMAEMAKAGRKRGTVVNIGSLAGLRIGPMTPHYSASKAAAVIHYSRALGDVYHFGDACMRVMCICPGLVDTAMMSSIEKNTFDDRTLASLKERCSRMEKMSPDELADALIQFIIEGKSGDVVVKSSGQKNILVPPHKDILELPELQ